MLILELCRLQGSVLNDATADNHCQDAIILHSRQFQLKMSKQRPSSVFGGVIAWTASDLDDLAEAITTGDGDDAVIGQNALTVLQMVFGRKLSRDHIWDVSGLSPEQQSLMGQVARIYKRGVETRGLVGSPLSPRTEETSKIIEVHGMDAVFTALKPGDIVIVDENVRKFWWHRLPAEIVSITFSELNKTVDLVNEIAKLLKYQLGHQGKLFVVGGGVAGDVCGFAAGLIGCPFIFVPTTLLSIVDSSIGGKVGVNFGVWGKNQLGLFYAPVEVRIWSGWLHTLTPNELRCGLVEAYKHALLSGLDSVRSGVKAAAAVVDDVSRCAQVISPLMVDIIAVKYQIVSRDPFEWGERASLNLGHTVGHALETMAAESGNTVTHGECVAVGLYCALRLSRKFSNFSGDDVISDLTTFGLIPASQRLIECWGDLTSFEAGRERFLQLLGSDKKNLNDQFVRFVLLRAPGIIDRGPGGVWTQPLPIEDIWHEVVACWSELTKK